MLIAQYIIVAVAIMALIAVYQHLKRKLTPAERLGYVSAIVLCLVSLVPSFVPTDEPDIAERQRAKLSSTLTLTSITNGRFDCDFTFRNAGPMKAYNIAYAIRTPDMIGVINHSSVGTFELAAGDVMDAYGGVFTTIPTNGDPVSVKLLLEYNTDVDAKTHKIASLYHFIVRQPLNIGQPIHCMRAVHREGNITDAEFSN